MTWSDLELYISYLYIYCLQRVLLYITLFTIKFRQRCSQLTIVGTLNFYDQLPGSYADKVATADILNKGFFLNTYTFRQINDFFIQSIYFNI